MKYVLKYCLVVSAIVILIISNLSCITIRPPSKGEPSATKQSQTAGSSGKTRPHPPVRTGDISTGVQVEIGTQAINTTGGGITVSQPGDALNGMTIGIPPQAYSNSRTYKITYKPGTGHTFGVDFTPASPLITIDNGGGYSDQLITVRVPVKIPDGYFAMGFLYNSTTKQLEGMPLLTKDADSITIGTRHFSSFLIGMIDKTKLKDDTDSGFRPGIDDWQFTNYGSHIAPGGHCEGQSLAAMWYYTTTPDGKEACLFNRYDNNGIKPETPNLWQDDSYGYRFCSVIHNDLNTLISSTTGFAYDLWSGISGRAWQKVNNKWQWTDVPPLIGDETTTNLFKFSIQMTGEPQLIKLQSKDSGGGGHTMICYRVNKGILYIADPNYPGNTDRKIELINNTFKPYNSGANKQAIDAGQGTSYDRIMYFAKTTVMPWDKIASRWAELKNGTIGNDTFPQIKPLVQDNNNWISADGYIAKDKKIRISPFSNPDSDIYRDGEKLAQDGSKYFELKPGENKLGIWMYSTANNEKLYIDFKYITIKFGEDECKTPPPANVMAKLQQTTRFRCELLNLPTNIVGSGSMQKWVPGFKFTKHFYVPGKAPESGDWAIPITWSGTSFSGGGSKGYPDRLSGSVCYSNGQVLVSFDYATNYPADNLRMSVKNLPCDPKRLLSPAAGGRSELMYMNTDAPTVKKYVTTLDWKSHEERPVLNGPPEVWDASLISSDWTNKCGFDLTIY